MPAVTRCCSSLTSLRRSPPSPSPNCSPAAGSTTRPRAGRPPTRSCAPSPGASYVFSKLEVQRDEPIETASVHLEIDHTFSGDLRVALITPGGEHIPVSEGKGGDKHDGDRGH